MRRQGPLGESQADDGLTRRWSCFWTRKEGESGGRGHGADVCVRWGAGLGVEKHRERM